MSITSASTARDHSPIQRTTPENFSEPLCLSRCSFPIFFCLTKYGSRIDVIRAKLVRFVEKHPNYSRARQRLLQFRVARFPFLGLPRNRTVSSLSRWSAPCSLPSSLPVVSRVTPFPPSIRSSLRSDSFHVRQYKSTSDNGTTRSYRKPRSIFKSDYCRDRYWSWQTAATSQSSRKSGNQYAADEKERLSNVKSIRASAANRVFLFPSEYKFWLDVISHESILSQHVYKIKFILLNIIYLKHRFFAVIWNAFISRNVDHEKRLGSSSVWSPLKSNLRISLIIEREREREGSSWNRKVRIAKGFRSGFDLLSAAAVDCDRVGFLRDSALFSV